MEESCPVHQEQTNGHLPTIPQDCILFLFFSHQPSDSDLDFITLVLQSFTYFFPNKEISSSKTNYMKSLHELRLIKSPAQLQISLRCQAEGIKYSEHLILHWNHPFGNSFIIFRQIHRIKANNSDKSWIFDKLKSQRSDHSKLIVLSYLQTRLN